VAYLFEIFVILEYTECAGL